jgi:hypothetical protein
MAELELDISGGTARVAITAGDLVRRQEANHTEQDALGDIRQLRHRSLK